MNLTELSMPRAGRRSTRRGAAWLVAGAAQDRRVGCQLSEAGGDSRLFRISRVPSQDFLQCLRFGQAVLSRWNLSLRFGQAMLSRRNPSLRFGQAMLSRWNLSLRFGQAMLSRRNPSLRFGQAMLSRRNPSLRFGQAMLSRRNLSLRFGVSRSVWQPLFLRGRQPP